MKAPCTCACKSSRLNHYLLLSHATGILQAFKATIAEELKELSSSPFGSTLVGTIGLAYYEAAVSFSSTMEGLKIGAAQTARGITTGQLVCLLCGCCGLVVVTEVVFFCSRQVFC